MVVRVLPLYCDGVAMRISGEISVWLRCPDTFSYLDGACWLSHFSKFLLIKWSTKTMAFILPTTMNSRGEIFYISSTYFLFALIPL